MDVKIIDDKGKELGPNEIGEIMAKHAWLMKGYWNKPELTNQTMEKGWVHTGDMGYMDEDGFLYIVDRKRDMIISGGENIYPREIEEVLYEHPAVREATVIGVPSEKWGEDVKAIIALKSGFKATEEEVIEFCKDRLAGYKKPKSVEFMDELPKTGSGKIYKKALRDKYWKGATRKVIADN